MLLEEATDEGLSGASFFGRRLLSNPFSRGEWAGLPLGEAGSWGGGLESGFILLIEKLTRCYGCHTDLVGNVHDQVVVTLLTIALLVDFHPQRNVSTFVLPCSRK